MNRIALGYFVFLAAVIFAADSGRLPRFAEHLHEMPGGDKVLHFLLFGLLALAANLLLARRTRWPLARAIVAGSLFALVIATAEEASNLLLERRGWSLGDLAANYLGIACVGVLPLWTNVINPRQSGEAADDSPGPHEPAAR